jgi:hypothetical protein
VFVMFGRAMLSAQFLEFTIFDLAQLDQRPAKDLNRGLKQVDGVLKRPAKDQAKGLKDLSEALRGEILEAINVRNKLAHSFLIEYRINRRVLGSIGWAKQILMAAIATFDDLNERLDGLAKESRSAKGVGSLSPEEEEAVLASARKWAEAGFPPTGVHAS